MAAAKSATVEEETEVQAPEETVQVFETPYGDVFEGGILDEIKIGPYVPFLLGQGPPFPQNWVPF